MLICDYFSGFCLGSEGVSEYPLIQILNLNGLSLGPFIGCLMFVINTMESDVVEKNILPPLVVDAMKRPSPLRSIVIISIISACVAFWPMMYIDVDLFGGNPAIFLFLFTIPAGIVVFIVSLWLVNRSHNNSLND